MYSHGPRTFQSVWPSQLIPGSSVILFVLPWSLVHWAPFLPSFQPCCLSGLPLLRLRPRIKCSM